MAALKMGNGLDDGVALGPLVNAEGRDKVIELVDDAVKRGAKILTGGKKPEGPGFFYPATVLDNVPDGAKMLNEEIFGPVASIQTFKSEDEAIRRANDTEYGLVAYLYTKDLSRGMRVSEKLDFGMIGLNRGLVSDPAAPFGGMKQSGLGREGAHEGLHGVHGDAVHFGELVERRASCGGTAMDVLMPQLGETVAEGKISKWFVAAGDAVKPGDNLFEIETDKVSMEVPAIAAGTLAEIRVQAGEVAPVGAVVAIIQGKGETVSRAGRKLRSPPRKRGPRPVRRTGSPLRGDERRTAAARHSDGALPRSALARAQLRPGAACRRHGRYAARAPPRGRSRDRSGEHQGLRPARPHRGARRRDGARGLRPGARAGGAEHRSHRRCHDRSIARPVRGGERQSSSPT